MKQSKYLLVPKKYMWKSPQIRKNLFYFMSKTSYDIKLFHLNNFWVRVIIIIIVSARDENIHIFASKTDVDSIFAYMYAKV